MNGAGPAQLSQRLDVWLHNARFAKTRSLAVALVQRGKVRVNRLRATKAGQSVKPGDILTLSLGPRVRIIEIVGLAQRRGPAAETANLYRELTPVADETTSSAPESRRSWMPQPSSPGSRMPGDGRPTKRDRREIDRLKNRFGEV